jgi:ribosomal protein S18 acetylase RimI-like enzyme
MHVREAKPGEWEIFRELRLRALEDDPDSFRARYEERVDAPESEWRESFERVLRDDHMVTFFAETDQPAGMSFARVSDGQLQIFGMWVAPEARGQGLGRALLDAAFLWGKVRGAASARLAVTIGNDAGEYLYAKAGFEPTGETEPLREGSELSCAWLERSL